jgi:uncharacterized protein
MKATALFAPLVLACMGCVPADDQSMSVGMANPASVYCVEKAKGTLVARQGSEGSILDCQLPDGRVVEEWQLFRAENP